MHRLLNVLHVYLIKYYLMMEVNAHQLQMIKKIALISKVFSAINVNLLFY